MADLATVRAPNGTTFRVNALDAPRWQAFLNDPAWGSFAFDQGQSGGYNNRNIAGTNTLSQHAHGRAIDVNWQDNPRGGDNRTTDDPTRQFRVLPADVARAVAERHGMTWGGEWSNPDPMHFELRRDGAPPPIGARSLVAHAGLTPPAPTTQPAPVQTQTPPTIPTPYAAPETPPAATLDGLTREQTLDIVRAALERDRPVNPLDEQPSYRQAGVPLDDVPMPQVPQMRRVDLSKLRASLQNRRLGRV